MTTDIIADLTERVKRLEQQVSHLQSARKENHIDLDDLFADNEMIARAFRAFLDAQGITGEPIGAEKLQQMIGLNEQDPNEFSRDIIEMREE